MAHKGKSKSKVGKFFSKIGKGIIQGGKNIASNVKAIAKGTPAQKGSLAAAVQGVSKIAKQAAGTKVGKVAIGAAKAIATGGASLGTKIGAKIAPALRQGAKNVLSNVRAIAKGTPAQQGSLANAVQKFTRTGPWKGTGLGQVQSISPNLPNYVPIGIRNFKPSSVTPQQETLTSPQAQKQIMEPIAQPKLAPPVVEEPPAPEFSLQEPPAQEEPSLPPADQTVVDTAQTLANQGLPPDQIAETMNQQMGGDFSATDVQGFLEGGQLAGAIPTETYVVQPGDTLNAIARRMGVAVSDISGYRSGNANLIYPGENLTINRAGAGKQNVSPASAPPASTLPTEPALTNNETGYLTYLQEKTYEDIYKTLTEQLGLDAVKDNINDINDKLQKLQDDRAEEEADINNNPWISEALRSKKIQSLGGKYDQKEANLREAIKNSQDVYDDARQEAQFAAKMWVDQSNENREFYYKVKQDAEEMKLKREDATPDIQEYKLAQTQGYGGSFLSYQREVANLKAKATGGAGGGLTPGQINTTVNSIAGAFDNEPIVKSYNTVQEGYQTLQGIGTQSKNPADDIAFIYAFAKVMDPNSVVREGEYNTIQKYAQTWADSFGFKSKRIFSNTNFLTPQAKQNMLNTLGSKVGSITTQYNNLYDQYQKQIQGAYAGQPRQITQYTPPSFTAPTTQTTPTTETKKTGGFWRDFLSNVFNRGY